MIGTRINNLGYVVFRKRDRRRGLIMEHILVAEKALGKPLPNGAVVHHHNKCRNDNRPTNLVICPDTKYHKHLHQRMDAKEACGNPNWLKCYVCKIYDAPENIQNYRYSTKPKSRGIFVHRDCHRNRQREYRKKKLEDAV